MSWITDNFPSLLVGLGLVLLVIEVVAFSMTGLVLTFAGLACITTGIIMWLTLIPATWFAACGSVALMSVGYALFLWEPLKKLQRSSGDTAVKGDFVGHRFVLEQAVSATEFGSHRFSGVNWKVRSDTPLPVGTNVEVVKAEVGFLIVARVAG
jgi:membrane protein implicated in regulation of membrane protease activity